MTLNMSKHGAKHSPPGHQVAPDWLRGGSSCSRSGHPFDPRYLWLKSMKQNKLDMYHHYFECSFELSIVEILKFTGTIEIPERFYHFS